jgi:hypothetical protein
MFRALLLNKEDINMQKTTFYTTIENQVRRDGSRGLLYDHFEDLNVALAKYYTICAAAAVSEIPYHAAHILHSDGYTIEQRIFDRRTDETEPEEETEPEQTT